MMKDFEFIKDNCTQAVNEFTEIKNTTVLNLKSFMPWYNKYKPLRERFSLPPLGYKELDQFFTIYEFLQEVIKITSNEVITADAVKDFKTLNTEKEKISWVVKHEKLGYYLLVFHLFESKKVEIDGKFFVDYYWTNFDFNDFVNGYEFYTLWEQEHDKIFRTIENMKVETDPDQTIEYHVKKYGLI